MDAGIGIHQVALVGSPNSGKSSLFNVLTGSRQKTGNYSGVTVEKKQGTLPGIDGQRINVFDLPGAHSLNGKSLDQRIVSDLLAGKLLGEEVPNLLVAVADASNLEKSLGFVIEVQAIGIPMVLALNMFDLAESRGLQIDLNKLESVLGCDVIPTVAPTGKGVEELVARIQSRLPELENYQAKPSSLYSTPEAVFSRVDEILNLVTINKIHSDQFSKTLDKVLLHPIFGLPVLGLVLLVMFQSIFAWAEPLMNLVEISFETLGQSITQVMPEGALRDLIVDGAIAGVGSVIIFMPQILILFLFIIVLEESGYLARAAFLLDRVLRKFGLHGRAFIPLLSAHACAIPAVMSARTIENHRERLVTILVSPLVSCSARLPVYALLIGAFIPPKEIFGFLGLQGLVFFALYLTGLFAAIVMAWALRHTVVSGEESVFILELPTYKIPSIRNIAVGLWIRSQIFLKRAGTLILSFSILLWFLASYPKAPESYAEPAIQYSFAGRLGAVVEPIVRPLGFDWRIATGMVPGFAAREVMVSALATVYAIEKNADGKELEEDEVESLLGSNISRDWSIATGLSLLVWYIFSPQCLATVAVIRRETNSWKWAGLYFFYALALAYLASFLGYHIFLMAGLG